MAIAISHVFFAMWQLCLCQKTESISWPVWIWSDPVTALDNKLWQKGCYASFGSSSWLVWRPLLPASSKTIMMERLQRPWDYHMRALEDQMPHEGREKPRSHRQQACEWRSCPGRSLPAQPLTNFPASWPWWVKWKDCFKPPCFGVVGYTAIDNCNSEEKEAIGRFWAIIWSDLSFIRIPLGLCWEQNENEERECGKETNLQSR